MLYGRRVSQSVGNNSTVMVIDSRIKARRPQDLRSADGRVSADERSGRDQRYYSKCSVVSLARWNILLGEIREIGWGLVAQWFKGKRKNCVLNTGSDRKQV